MIVVVVGYCWHFDTDFHTQSELNFAVIFIILFHLNQHLIFFLQRFGTTTNPTTLFRLFVLLYFFLFFVVVFSFKKIFLSRILSSEQVRNKLNTNGAKLITEFRVCSRPWARSYIHNIFDDKMSFDHGEMIDMTGFFFLFILLLLLSKSHWKITSRFVSCYWFTKQQYS